MRRKDLRYYCKTIVLRLKSRRFRTVRNSKKGLESFQSLQQEYMEKLRSEHMDIGLFDPYFHTYFYFNSLDIFSDVYEKTGEIPISLKGGQINPLLPIYYGLVRSNVDEDARLSTCLQQICDLVTSMATESDTEFALPYEFDYTLFDLKSPWLSGITQSMATCLFLRTYYYSSNKKYLLYATKSFECILNVENGLLVSTAKGVEWVEEYPSRPSSFVLNGHLFAIIAAIEMFQITGQEKYRLYSSTWIKSLCTHLPEYQFQEFLLHNKRQDKLSNIEYQGLYVGLFKHLHILTKHTLFLELEVYYSKSTDWKAFKKFYGIKS